MANVMSKVFFAHIITVTFLTDNHLSRCLCNFKCICEMHTSMSLANSCYSDVNGHQSCHHF